MDGILRKDFNTSDYSFEFGKKKRGLSANSSLYYGMPYRIYSSTPNYNYTDRICNYFLLFYKPE
jgi:hypothetical protein